MLHYLSFSEGSLIGFLRFGENFPFVVISDGLLIGLLRLMNSLKELMRSLSGFGESLHGDGFEYIDSPLSDILLCEGNVT